MICSKCKHENHSLASFCSNCGQKLSAEKDINYNIPIKNILFFFFTLLAYIIVLNFTPLANNYISLLLIDSIFALIVLIFFIVNFKSTIRLFRFKKKSAGIIFKIIIIAPSMALIVHFFAKFLNQSVFDSSETIYYNQFKDSPAPLLFTIISIGVFPAIFEELAFRGILFNNSLKIMGLKQTILVTSILFTILHLSLISVLWIFPIGLLLGYLRARHRSILYSILGHFLYNTSVMLLQIILSN